MENRIHLPQKNIDYDPKSKEIIILRMRLISTIVNFYWSHAIPLQKLSNERSHKFS